ncbi:hypothetical protein [Hugenholtzia roseola]|uniref:hypothetical protein n=1 Tax=Hugenholtzia roseola TaxID=1002 RepID=UPI0003FB9AE5|nr:hypothetical protein [Hugenholtzia roseola]
MEKKTYQKLYIGLASAAALTLLVLGILFQMNKIVPDLELVSESYDYQVFGTLYEGKSRLELDKIIQKHLQLLKEEKAKGKLFIYYYHNPDTAASAKVFSGIWLEDGFYKQMDTAAFKKALPESFQPFEFQTFSLQKRIRATVKGKSIFRPSPQTVSEHIQDFAQKNNLKLASAYLDIAAADHTTQTEHLLQQEK